MAQAPLPCIELLLRVLQVTELGFIGSRLVGLSTSWARSRLSELLGSVVVSILCLRLRLDQACGVRARDSLRLQVSGASLEVRFMAVRRWGLCDGTRRSSERA